LYCPTCGRRLTQPPAIHRESRMHVEERKIECDSLVRAGSRLDGIVFFIIIVHRARSQKLGGPELAVSCANSIF
jgi:hypothetical protein